MRQDFKVRFFSSAVHDGWNQHYRWNCTHGYRKPLCNNRSRPLLHNQGDIFSSLLLIQTLSSCIISALEKIARGQKLFALAKDDKGDALRGSNWRSLHLHRFYVCLNFWQTNMGISVQSNVFRPLKARFIQVHELVCFDWPCVVTWQTDAILIGSLDPNQPAHNSEQTVNLAYLHRANIITRMRSKQW